MAIERTISIIKPDAVAKDVIGQIYSRFENNGLKVIAAKMKQLSRAEAEGFYAVHKERPFFADLVAFMTSGPVMIQVLSGDNAVAKNRELWAPPILKKPPPAPSAPTLPSRLTPMPYTAPTAWKMPPLKSPISLTTAKSARANHCCV